MADAAAAAAPALTLFVGADHGGYELKRELVEYLASAPAELAGVTIEVEDLGCHEPKRCDYPDIAHAVSKRVVGAGGAARGLLVCGSGIGISIAANKVKGVRCALCHDHYSATMCRKHNNANVIAMGGRNTGPDVAKEMLASYLTTAFEGEGDAASRHVARIAKIELSAEEGGIDGSEGFDGCATE